MIQNSEWTYATAASIGASAGELMASGGMFILRDPSERLHSFKYRGLGAGLGSRRLPDKLRLPDLTLPRGNVAISGSGASSDFFGRGRVWRFVQKELTPHDFSGATIYAEGSAGVLVAGSATGLITGIDNKAIIPWLFNPPLFAHAIGKSAKGLIGMAGMSEGLVDGVGVSLMLGTITYEGPYTG